MGTLPVVWTPPQEIRDLRELPRTRMALKRIEVKIKNRIHAALTKHGIQISEASDIFGRRGLAAVHARLADLPTETRRTTERLLDLRAKIAAEIKELEDRIEEVIGETPERRLVETIPGIGPTLGTVVVLEVGLIDRFPRAENLASYSGTVPRVISSGGRTYHGQVRPDVNRYLKWAFVEAANQIVMRRRHTAGTHVYRLYDRIRQRKGHQKAVVALARHLAEATYWVLKKREPYREPKPPVSSTQG
jgi:transposase